MSKKKNENITMIGGADGPTSVFLVGKSGKRSLTELVSGYFYQKKRNYITKKIIADPHSLEEVAEHIKTKYGAAEIPETTHRYIEQRKGLKEGLTEETAKQMLERLEKRSGVIETISEEEMPMDYHVYEICQGKGRMDIDIDYKWDFLGCSYSGNKKEMKRFQEISKEIYLYYGVTEEDIANQTRRYKELIGMLSDV